MSGERRVIADPAGAVSPLLASLSTALPALRRLDYALVGGMAVFIRLGVTRSTQDLDAALKATAAMARQVVAAVGTPAGPATFRLEDGVELDVLLSDPTKATIRPGMGRQREARFNAVRLAIDTAEEVDVALDPPLPVGDLRIRVATISALVALKLVALDDPRRESRKRASDLHDLWGLVASKPTTTPRVLDQLMETPLAHYCAEQLEHHFHTEASLLAQVLRGTMRGPTDVQDVNLVWRDLLAPHLLRS